MTFLRLRVLRSSVVGCLLLAVGSYTSAQAPATGRETSAASVAAYGLSQQMPVDPEVVVGTLPNGLRYYVRANAQAGPPRRAAARRQGRFGAGRRRPAGAGALRRAHGVRRHAALSAAEHRRLPVVARPEHRCRTRTRRPATTTRSTRCACRPTCPACSIARCSSSRTGRRAPRSIRAASTASAASSSSEWRMNLGAGERTADKIRRVQLEGSRYADRPPIGKPDDHRARAARAADALLSRLVPPGPDGGDRRRRRRSRRRRRR